MTPEEFLEKLKGPNVLVRLELVQTNKSIVMAHGRVYVYLEEDGNQFAGEIIYGCNSHGVYRELEYTSFPDNPRNWKRRAHSFMNQWETQWWHNREVVCTFHPTGGELSVIKPSNPLVLTHLARLEGMLLAADSGYGEFVDDMYAIAARRLSGLVRGLAMDWTKLV